MCDYHLPAPVFLIKLALLDPHPPPVVLMVLPNSGTRRWNTRKQVRATAPFGVLGDHLCDAFARAHAHRRSTFARNVPKRPFLPFPPFSRGCSERLPWHSRQRRWGFTRSLRGLTAKLGGPATHGRSQFDKRVQGVRGVRGAVSPYATWLGCCSCF